MLTFGLFVGLGVGGLAAVGTAAGFLIDSQLSGDEAQSAWIFTPTVAPQNLGLTLGRRF